MNQAINDTYIKIIAKRNGVTVSGKEVDTRLNEAREQNRLGSNNKVFSEVLRDYFGWSISDYKRSLKQEMLAEKVSQKLDTAANQKAQSALSQLNGGANFADVAKSTSEDPSKDNGGDYGYTITRSNPNVPPEVVDAIFKLKAGQYSDIILASPVLSSQPPSLQIIKVSQTDGKTVTAQHIVINLKNPDVYAKEQMDKNPPKKYI